MHSNDKLVNFLITLFLGIFGVHKFINKQTGKGLLYLFTGGLFGIGWIIDVVRCLKETVDSKNTDSGTGISVNGNENIKDADGNASFNTVKDNSIRKVGWNRHFPFFDDKDRYLRYAYGVEVKGVKYRDFDISKIQLEHELQFETEPNNKFDPNAIKVLYDDIFIGYVPKGSIFQRMIPSYGGDGIKKQVCGIITYVDENLRKIEMDLGFYEKYDDGSANVIETRLVGTKKSNIYDRESVLPLVDKHAEVTLEYHKGVEKYLVRSLGDYIKLGEINKNVSKKIKDFEDEGMNIRAGISYIDEDAVIEIKIIIR